MSGTTVATMDPQHGSGLVQIPLEVLTRITHFISTTDLGNVRLSCKALEQGLFHFFSHEFFRKKQFMVISDSLQALVDISKHPNLSPFLKHVIIATDRPAEHRYVPGRSHEATARLLVANADHAQLLAAGGLRDMLAEAFANLTNLETVDIRTFNSPSRSRDGRGTQWRSWGANTLAASTNTAVTTSIHNPQDPYLGQIFMSVTAALAAAQARPKSIEVLVRPPSSLPLGYNAIALRDGAFYIPPRIEATVSPVLANLQSLHLTLSLTHITGTKPFMLQKFLSLTVNLTWLRVNFHNTAPGDQQEVLSWLALKDTQTPKPAFDRAPVQLPRLERFDLGDAELKAESLLNLVVKFAPTLTSLYLRRVCLVGEGNAGTTNKINPWDRCLSMLSKIRGLNLRVLDLSQIAHLSGGFKGSVPFKPTEDSVMRDWTCSTNLVTLEKAIAQAVAAMAPDWPLAPDPDQMDEDGSDDDDQDDEDDDGEEESDGEGASGDDEDS